MNHKVITLSFILFAHSFLWAIRDPISAGELIRGLENIMDSSIADPDDLQGYDQKAYNKITDALSALKSLDDLNQSLPENILSDVVGNTSRAIEFLRLAIQESESEPSPGDSDIMQQLQSDLEKLQDLQRRQDSLNEKMGQASASGQKGNSNQELAREQDEIRHDLNNLREQRYQRSGKLGDVDQMDQAKREMKDGAGDLRMDQPRAAQPHGDLASEALKNAISQVEQEMSQVAADRVDQLTQEANELGENQGELKSKTNMAGRGDGGELRQEQEGLNRKIDELLEKMEALAPALNGFEERALDELQKMSRDARGGNLEKSGKRASNSLLYDAFSQAQKEQGNVEQELGDLQKGLQKLEDQLRYGDSAGLIEAAKHLNKMNEQGQGMSEEQFRQANEEAAQVLGNLPHAESDERLFNLTRMFEESAISEDIKNGRSLSAGAVQQASQLIEQFFWQQAVQENLLRNHQNTRAPTRYRNQVEEYFRRIAEGE